MTTPSSVPRRLPDIATLTSASGLESVLGPVREVVVEPVKTIGFSSSQHARLRVTLGNGESRSLFLKTVDPSLDVMTRLTDSKRSPETVLLETDSLRDVWTGFSCPFVAFAEDGDERAGVLMEDLGAFLFPDVREPVSAQAEDALLASLATMHARFWGRVPELPWLVTPKIYASFLAPEGANDPRTAVLGSPVLDAVRAGWRIALERMPEAARARVETPVAVLLQEWAPLPHTLVHGDAKVANFALHPDGRVSAFDWAWVGRAPASVDLGFYLAVNATRLAGTKEDAIRTYRSHLERALGHALPAELWAALERAAILFGARVLLWSKASALAAGRPGAQAEWDWWMERLATS